MKFLNCKLCMGEVDVIDNDRSFIKKIKCRKCGYSNQESKGPEVVIIRRRSNNEE